MPWVEVDRILPLRSRQLVNIVPIQDHHTGRLLDEYFAIQLELEPGDSTIKRGIVGDKQMRIGVEGRIGDQLADMAS